MSGGRQAGFAIIIVLWVLVLLSLILTHVLSSGRAEAQLAGNLRDGAVAEAVADGAIQETVFHLLAPGALAWPPRGEHALRIGRGTALVAIEDVAAKVNPNSAGLQMLSALIAQCGLPPFPAAQLARNIMVWRGDPVDDTADPAVAYGTPGLPYAPPGLPLETLDELQLIGGMTPPLYACLAPHLSLYQQGDPARSGDDPLVARALAAAAQQGYAPRPAIGTSGVVEITAIATAEGGRFTRRATVRLTAPDGNRPFRILQWQSP